jgi:hypothetical protein
LCLWHQAGLVAACSVESGVGVVIITLDSVGW